MRPLLHASLVNGRFGDAALFIEMKFERRAILFDLGDIQALSERDIARLEHVCVSHTHVDHFYGFDRLLRVLVGREATVNLYGPEGFVAQVKHKLNGYTWNLIDKYLLDLVFVVTEIAPSLETRRVRFCLKSGFAAEELDRGNAAGGLVVDDPVIRITTAPLDHRVVSLAYAVEETGHVNVFNSRLVELDLAAGPWLAGLKRAVLADRPDDFPVSMDDGRKMPLGALRHMVTITSGQKIAYVTDARDSPENRAAIVRLARGADTLFIEASFARDDDALAAERAHLTTRAAGELGRVAGARRVEPFHFSARYEGQERRMLQEVTDAFLGRP